MQYLLLKVINEFCYAVDFDLGFCLDLVKSSVRNVNDALVAAFQLVKVMDVQSDLKLHLLVRGCPVYMG